MEGLSTEALQAARFPEARVAAMRDALRLADELTGLRRALEGHVAAAVRGCGEVLFDSLLHQASLQGLPEAQRDAMQGLLTGVMTRLTALQDARMDTVAHLALHEVPFDTRLYRQAARAVSRAAARYLDAVLRAADGSNPSAQLGSLADGLQTVHRCFAFAEGWDEGAQEEGLQERYRALQQVVVQCTRAVMAGV